MSCNLYFIFLFFYFDICLSRVFYEIIWNFKFHTKRITHNVNQIYKYLLKHSRSNILLLLFIIFFLKVIFLEIYILYIEVYRCTCIDYGRNVCRYRHRIIRNYLCQTFCSDPKISRDFLLFFFFLIKL